jgi:CBS domain containing-hemolysin-like protein
MVPRKRISAISIDTPLNEVVSVVAQSPYSRLPVYRGTIDNIVGILRTKDLVRWFVEGVPGLTLAQLIRSVPTVHESVTADRVLKDLRERRSHQALVVDEFGGTAGLLTLADVLTELLGHVGDEFRSGQPVAETLSDGRIRLPGEMGVNDAALLLETTWETDASTVGGLVTEALGHIPSEGDTTVVGGFEFGVERVKDRIPQSVVARRVVPVSSEEAR